MVLHSGLYNTGQRCVTSIPGVQDFEIRDGDGDGDGPGWSITHKTSQSTFISDSRAPAACEMGPEMMIGHGPWDYRGPGCPMDGDGSW